MYALHSPIKFLNFSWALNKLYCMTISCHAIALTISIKVSKETQYSGRTDRDKLWEWYHRADGGSDRRISQKTAGRKLVVMITCLPSSWEGNRLWLESTQEEEIIYANKTPLSKTACKHQVPNQQTIIQTINATELKIISEK